MKFLHGVGTGLVLLMLTTACSGPEPDQTPSPLQADVASLTAEHDRLQHELLQVETQLDSVSIKRDELEERLGSVTAARDLLQEHIHRVEADLSSAVRDNDLTKQDLRKAEAALASAVSKGDELSANLAALEGERDDLRLKRQAQDARIAELETELREARAASEQAQQQATYLLSKYDEKIRADLQAAIDAEIERACAAATTRETYETLVTDIVSWQPDWEPITTRTELEMAVEQCAAPERVRLAEQYRAELSAAIGAEIKRACAAAIEEYNEPIDSFPQWEPEWELVMTRLEQIETVVECAKPERTKRITAEIQAAVDAEIERSCAVAIERYHQSVGLIVRWRPTWVLVITSAQLIEAVEECAEPERGRLVRAELEAAVDAEIERACAVASRRYEEPIGSIIRWDSRWEEVTTRAIVEEAVERCAKSERERLAEERREELRAEVDEEIARACRVLSAQRRATASSVVRWDSEWEEITSRDRLQKAVEDCANKRVAEALAECERINVDQLEKNPDGLTGTCLVMYAYIVQYDSATGPCSFHAELSRSRSTRWYDYDVRSTFGYLDNELASSVVADCPELDRIDTDDYIKVWATVLGSFSYETTMGGTNHVPSFRIEKVELVRKN